MDVLDYVTQSELAYHFKMKSKTIQFDDRTEPMLSIFVRTNSEPDCCIVSLWFLLHRPLLYEICLFKVCNTILKASFPWSILFEIT